MDPRPLLLASALILLATFRPSVVDGISQCKVKWYLWHLWDPCQQWNRPKDHETDMKYCFFCDGAHTCVKSSVKRLFGISCPEVSERLVGQIQAWQIKESCLDEGESCSYELVSTSPYLITATHTSPDTRKVSNLEFLLEQSTICKMTGQAASEITAPPADNNTNYCSLQNLMDGSDLISAEGYKQFSNKWICPGFDTANCTVP